MRRTYTNTCSWIMMLALAMSVSFARAGVSRQQKTDTTYLHIQKLNKAAKSSYLKNGFKVSLPAPTFKPITATASKAASPDDKLLSNIQVYPNPVTDQINLKYMISRNSNVSIKIMDVLGNEIATLFSQRVDSGEKKFTYNLSNKLNSGFYFVRIVAGTESVNKRISIF